MTLRLRPRTRRSRRGLFETEDRRDFLVNIGFLLLIVALVLGLLLAIGLSYYDTNLRPLAHVGAQEITPSLVRDRTALDIQRIARDEGRLRQLQIDNEINLATLSAKMSELDQKQQALTADSVSEELIDLIFQSQLAAQEGVAPSDADVTAAVDKEFKTPERRHILLISVTPESDDAASRPTVSQRQAAIAKATEALAAVQAGTDWATVAAQYSDDPGAATGGDGGTISANNPNDAGWTKAIFALPAGGTTGVVGSLGCARADAGDCVYRIGRLADIVPGAADNAYRDKVLAKVNPDRLREIIGWELAADRLREKITTGATSGTVDQVHLAEIIIRDTEFTEGEDATPTPAPSGAIVGDVRYRQILYSPNDDPQTAPEVPPSDPAWPAAKELADRAYATINAITDPQARADKFAEIAKAESDEADTKADGGEVDFISRDLLPPEVAKALFDTPHQEGDLIAPVKEETGYYVLLYEEHRGTPQQRLEELKAEIAAGADWTTLVDKYSDAEDTDKADGGDIGWYSREMLSQVETETVDKLFALKAGDVSEPIAFGTDSLVFKALDHTDRALDADQLVQLTDPEFGVFATWYSDKKTQAETDRVIGRAGDEPLPVEEPSESP